MRIAKLIIGFGIILVAFGALFQFQGRGVVGPESSFMYHNNDWIYYGITIIISGVMIVGVGVFMLLRAKLRAR
jgi:uncharacterized membrane protein YidH (DUF202 family)